MKNRLLITVAVLSYLGFYLLSPFFHFHHDDSLPGINQEYHSHLLTDNKSYEANEDDHHSFENENHHNHRLIINTITTTNSPRITESSINVIAYTDYVDNSIENPFSKINTYSDFLFSKLKWDKCVHSASNVSPPSKSIA